MKGSRPKELQSINSYVCYSDLWRQRTLIPIAVTRKKGIPTKARCAVPAQIAFHSIRRAQHKPKGVWCRFPLTPRDLKIRYTR